MGTLGVQGFRAFGDSGLRLRGFRVQGSRLLGLRQLYHLECFWVRQQEELDDQVPWQERQRFLTTSARVWGVLFGGLKGLGFRV